jgi:hypothetical protein
VAFAVALAGSPASAGSSGGSPQQAAVHWYTLRLNGKYAAMYPLIWAGQAGPIGPSFTQDDWLQCEDPSLDLWTLAHSLKKIDGVKAVGAAQSITINSPGRGGANTIQGVRVTVEATRHGRVVSTPPSEQLWLTKDTSAGDSGKQWLIVVKDPENNPCDVFQGSPPSS